MNRRQQATQFAGQVAEFFKPPVLPAAEMSPTVVRAERLAFTFCKRTSAGQVPAALTISLERRRGLAR